MTKMAATPIYGKNPSQIFSGTDGQITTKLGMLHRVFQPIIVCSNDDPGLTLTYITARSDLVKIGCSIGKSEENRGFFINYGSL